MKPISFKFINAADLSYLGVSFLARFVNIFTMLFAVSRIGSSGFGVFSFVQATGLTLATLLTLAITTSLNVILARDKEAAASGHAASFCIFYVLICGVILLPLFFMPPGLIHGLDASIGVRVALYVFAISMISQNVFQGWLFGFARTAYVGFVTLFSALVSLAVLFIAPAGHGESLMIAYGLGVLAGAVLQGFSVYRHSGIVLPSPRDAYAFCRQHGPVLLSYGLKSIVNSAIFQVGLWQLQAHIIGTTGPVESAHFALGVQFYNIVIFIPVLIGPIFLNRLGKLSDQPRRALRLSLIATFICGALAAGGLAFCWLTFPLLSHFLPHAYQAAQAAILWAIAAGAVLFVKAPMSIYFQSVLKAFPETVANVLASIALLLIPFMIFRATAAQAAEIRLGAHMIQFVAVAGCFVVLYLRAGGSSPERRSRWAFRRRRPPTVPAVR
jgi:O-antigen/teichoic acid export membrane protein